MQEDPNSLIKTLHVCSSDDSFPSYVLFSVCLFSVYASNSVTVTSTTITDFYALTGRAWDPRWSWFYQSYPAHNSANISCGDLFSRSS